MNSERTKMKTLEELCNAVPQEVVDAMKECVGDIDPGIRLDLAAMATVDAAHIRAKKQEVVRRGFWNSEAARWHHMILLIESERTR